MALLTLAIAVIAFLYSSVGHAGASGYIAVMALFGFSQTDIKPTALVLNIVVATLASIQFWRAGHFSWHLFWPLALLSVPLAFVGGRLHLPTQAFKILLGAVLLFSAVRLALTSSETAKPILPMAKSTALTVGGAIGLLAGLTGTGGGIFLTPLVILKSWAKPKTASAVSAVFILGNSTAGLLGNLSANNSFPTVGVPLAAAAVTGGLVGSRLGSTRFGGETTRRVLAVVLVIAGTKLIFVA